MSIIEILRVFVYCLILITQKIYFKPFIIKLGSIFEYQNLIFWIWTLPKWLITIEGDVQIQYKWNNRWWWSFVRENDEISNTHPKQIMTHLMNILLFGYNIPGKSRRIMHFNPLYSTFGNFNTLSFVQVSNYVFLYMNFECVSNFLWNALIVDLCSAYSAVNNENILIWSHANCTFQSSSLTSYHSSAPTFILIWLILFIFQGNAWHECCIWIAARLRVTCAFYNWCSWWHTRVHTYYLSP